MRRVATGWRRVAGTLATFHFFVAGLILFAGDLHTAAAGYPPGVRHEAAGEHAQQAGLPVTVASHDADPVAVVHPDGDVAEHHACRKLKV